MSKRKKRDVKKAFWIITIVFLIVLILFVATKGWKSSGKIIRDRLKSEIDNPVSPSFTAKDCEGCNEIEEYCPEVQCYDENNIPYQCDCPKIVKDCRDEHCPSFAAA